MARSYLERLADHYEKTKRAEEAEKRRQERLDEFKKKDQEKEKDNGRNK